MKLKERTKAARAAFRQLDEALDKMVYADQPTRLIISNSIRKANEEILEVITKLIKKEYEGIAGEVSSIDEVGV